MDDLLYTLFVVAWIAYGIYKGVKKNNKPKRKTIPAQDRATETPKKKNPEGAFQAIFNEVFDLPSTENDKMSHPYAEEIVEKEPEMAPFYENYAGKEVLDSYKGSDNVTSVFKEDSEGNDVSSETNKIFDNQMEEEAGDDQNTVFDLRQAIIHQVILQRPY